MKKIMLLIIIVFFFAAANAQTFGVAKSKTISADRKADSVRALLLKDTLSTKPHQPAVKKTTGKTFAKRDD